MTLPASGAISLSAVNTELGRSSTAQININDSSVRDLLDIPSGAINLNSAHGKTKSTVPGAPTLGTATVASSTSASVPFTAPGSNGGKTITSYTATSSPGGLTGTLSQSGSGTITVSGLTPGTAYTFTVTANENTELLVIEVPMR